MKPLKKSALLFLALSFTSASAFADREWMGAMKCGNYRTNSKYTLIIEAISKPSATRGTVSYAMKYGNDGDSYVNLDRTADGCQFYGNTLTCQTDRVTAEIDLTSGDSSSGETVYSAKMTVPAFAGRGKWDAQDGTCTVSKAAESTYRDLAPAYGKMGE